LCDFVPSKEQDFLQTMSTYDSLLPLVEVITNILKYQPVEVKLYMIEIVI